jgi:hypothetical protein
VSIYGSSCNIIISSNPLKTELLLNNIYSVRTSQETYYFSGTKSNRLILFRETVAVYCENHTKRTNTLGGQNREFIML